MTLTLLSQNQRYVAHTPLELDWHEEKKTLLLKAFAVP